MARVNVEDDAYVRVGKLAAIMQVSDREALGTVTILWRDSQDVLAPSGSREDILDWSHLYGLTAAEEDRWLQALERARFISKQKSGRYLVHGNEVQIDARVSRMNRATKGAEATKRKWAAIKAQQELEAQNLTDAKGGLEEGLEHSASLPEAGLDHTNAMQGNAKQFNADVFVKPADPDDPSDYFSPGPIIITHAAHVLGPIQELKDAKGEDMLSDIRHESQVAWMEAWGIDLIREELPFAKAKWTSDPLRQIHGGKSLYLARWFANAHAQRKDKARGDPAVKSISSGAAGLSVETHEETRARLKREAQWGSESDKADTTRVKQLIRQVTGGGGPAP